MPRRPAPTAPHPRQPAPAPHVPSGANTDAGPHATTHAPADAFADDYEEEGGGFPWRTAVVLVMLALMGGGAYAMYRSGQLASLPFLGAPGQSATPVIAAPNAPSVTTPETAPTQQSAAAGVNTVEAQFLKSPLWSLLRREFPEWYNGKIAAVRTQTVEGKAPKEITSNMLREVVILRRQQSGPALAASSPRLRAIASAFVDNLNRLKQHSTAACYGFISQGETSPTVMNAGSTEIQVGIDAQLRAIFEAVAEGRKSPLKHDSPRREDYDVLTAELAKRGWNTADLQMFANAKALERAPPEKVCQMVNDWFSAQLAVKDSATQTRLLSEALKPIVAG
ncbi:MAG: hypothetical protein R3D67_18420 [Hyphomicrobiaceae bacterium]